MKMANNRLKRLPVRIYRKANHLGLVAPLAGLEPGDISVSIAGKERGPRQHDLHLVKAEWTIGPYQRKITLPEVVDGTLANATYGNGVLVLMMPKATAGNKPKRVEFTLESVTPTRGERIGHMGHAIKPTSTAEHFGRHADKRRKPA